jgi:hypothetical protein
MAVAGRRSLVSLAAVPEIFQGKTDERLNALFEYDRIELQ